MQSLVAILTSQVAFAHPWSIVVVLDFRHSNVDGLNSRLLLKAKLYYIVIMADWIGHIVRRKCLL
jgi:hypothetical protein